MIEETTPQDLIPLGNSRIRRYILQSEWVYNLDDLVDSFREDVPFFKGWWRDFTQKRDERAYAHQIKTILVNGKEERVLNATGVFRLVQGVRGKKAEEVKNWIAQIAVERVQEELEPSLAVDRAVKNWYAKGRSDAWIMERLRSIKVRRAFTDEMQVHGAEGRDYAILTNIVHEGTFGITVRQHKELKTLSPDKPELREEMTTTELLLLALGEHTSTMIAKASVSKSLSSATSACKTGGGIAGETRKRIEQEIGRAVVTAERASDEALPALDLE